MIVKKTCFFVQSLHLVDGRQYVGELRRFGFRDQALAVAEALSAYDAGVICFEIDGDPYLDLWDEPVELARYGIAAGKGALGAGRRLCA